MKKDIILIDKTVLENIFLRYGRGNTGWISRGFFLCLSTTATLLLSKFTTDNYGTFLWLDADDSEMLLEVLLFLFVMACAIFGIIWLNYRSKDKIVSTDTLKDEIIKNNQYEEDYTYILLFPKLKNNQLYFLVKQKDKWDNCYFFPYLKHTYGDENISVNELKIKEQIRSTYGIEIPIDIKEITSNSLSVTKLKSCLPKDFYMSVLPLLFSRPFCWST